MVCDEKVVCENTIEDVNFKLYSNNTDKSYQRLKLTNTLTGVVDVTGLVAPVDFYTLINCILFSDTLDDFIEGVDGVCIVRI